MRKHIHYVNKDSVHLRNFYLQCKELKFEFLFFYVCQGLCATYINQFCSSRIQGSNNGSCNKNNRYKKLKRRIYFTPKNRISNLICNKAENSRKTKQTIDPCNRNSKCNTRQCYRNTTKQNVIETTPYSYRTTIVGSKGKTLHAITNNIWNNRNVTDTVLITHPTVTRTFFEMSMLLKSIYKRNA